MYRILSNLLALVRTRQPRPAPRPQGRARLRLEAMEDRLVLSTVVPTPAAPLTSPAHTAPLPAPAGTSDGQSAAAPEQVCGYKHRGPCNGPRPIPYLSQLSPVLAVRGNLPVVAQASQLVAGGNDGPTVSISGAGHVVVRAPEGPLPFDAVTAKR